MASLTGYTRGVGVKVFVGVGVTVGVFVRVGVIVGELEGVGVRVGVRVRVAVGLTVGVRVCVTVGVIVRVLEGVEVNVAQFPPRRHCPELEGVPVIPNRTCRSAKNPGPILGNESGGQGP